MASSYPEEMKAGEKAAFSVWYLSRVWGAKASELAERCGLGSTAARYMLQRSEDILAISQDEEDRSCLTDGWLESDPTATEKKII